MSEVRCVAKFLRFCGENSLNAKTHVCALPFWVLAGRGPDLPQQLRLLPILPPTSSY